MEQDGDSLKKKDPLHDFYGEGSHPKNSKLFRTKRI